MQPNTLTMTVVRLAAAIGAFLVMALILAIILAAVLRGVSLASPQVAQLITNIGVLLTLAVALAGTSVAANGVAQTTQNQAAIQAKVTDVQEKVNGHLAAHTELTADNIQALVQQAIAAEFARQAGATDTPREVPAT